MYLILFDFFQNVEFIKNKFMSENCFYENEVNNIKYLLDKMSDVIGNDNILDRNKLMKLLEYIKKNEDYLVNDIKVYSKLKA
jgi:hypothetical protein